MEAKILRMNSWVSNLTFTTLWADSADDKVIIFFFPQKIGFDISCKLSPKEGDSLYEMSDPISGTKIRGKKK